MGSMRINALSDIPFKSGGKEISNFDKVSYYHKELPFLNAKPTRACHDQTYMILTVGYCMNTISAAAMLFMPSTLGPSYKCSEPLVLPTSANVKPI